MRSESIALRTGNLYWRGRLFSTHPRRWSPLASFLLVAALAAQERPADPLADFGTYPGAPAPRFTDFSSSTHLVPMRDGVRLAVDVVLPGDGLADESFPTLVRVTRTWRAVRDASLGPEERFFGSFGYAFVKVDARGSGASFGSRELPWSPEEREDGAEILQWIASQPWSDGRIGAIGLGYDGSAAELLAAAAPKLCRAVYSMFAVHDAYQEWLFPGGVLLVQPLAAWTEAMAALDRNRWPFPSDGSPLGVRPLDQDVAESLLGEALRAHQDNRPLLPQLARVLCRDDRLDPSGMTIDRFSPHSAWPALRTARTPLLLRAGWHDAATASGVIQRFLTGKGPFRAAIGPEARFRPGMPGQAGFRPQEIVEYQATQGEWAEALRFFDRHVRGQGTSTGPERILFYHTLGEGRWKATTSWPPIGVAFHSFYLGAEGGLAPEPEPDPRARNLDARLRATRGPSSRWQSADFTFGIREGVRIEESGPRLVWLGAPLEQAIEITGSPVVHLRLASSADDVVLYIYLDLLAPGGRFSCLTEGVLRANHRPSALDQGETPMRTFLRRDLAPLKPKEPYLHSFPLQPISVLVPEGHRLRLSLAASDVDTSPLPPMEGALELLIWCGGSQQPSRLELPLVPRASTGGRR